jgi:hypothetical protein
MNDQIPIYEALIAHHKEHHADEDALRARVAELEGAMEILADVANYDYSTDYRPYIHTPEHQDGILLWRFAAKFVRKDKP